MPPLPSRSSRTEKARLVKWKVEIVPRFTPHISAAAMTERMSVAPLSPPDILHGFQL
jgi:hypothetical protein